MTITSSTQLIQPPESWHDLTFTGAPQPYFAWCIRCERGFMNAVDYVNTTCVAPSSAGDDQ